MHCTLSVMRLDQRHRNRRLPQKPPVLLCPSGSGSQHPLSGREKSMQIGSSKSFKTTGKADLHGNGREQKSPDAVTPRHRGRVVGYSNVVCSHKPVTNPSRNNAHRSLSLATSAQEPPAIATIPSSQRQQGCPTDLRAITRNHGLQASKRRAHLWSDAEAILPASCHFRRLCIEIQSTEPSALNKSSLACVARLMKSTQHSSGRRETPAIHRSILRRQATRRRSSLVVSVHVPHAYKMQGTTAASKNLIRSRMPTRRLHKTS